MFFSGSETTRISRRPQGELLDHSGCSFQLALFVCVFWPWWSVNQTVAVVAAAPVVLLLLLLLFGDM